MRLRTFLTATASVALTIGTAAVVAPTASAAGGLSDFCTAINGYSLNTSYVGIGSGTPFNVGERVSVTVNAPSSGASTATLQVPGNVNVGSGPLPATLAYTVSQTGIKSVAAFVNTGGATFTWACGLAPAVESVPIPMWVQAFGRASKDAPCPDGWNPSWEQWPNSGKGGFVCNRSIKSVG